MASLALIIASPRAPGWSARLGQGGDRMLVKVMSWYDNEWGCTGQMIREAFSALGLPVPDLGQAGP